MWKLPDGRSEAALPDGKAPYDRAQAVAEASRCLYCYDAPCVRACPTGIDIPEFIRRIASDNVKASAKTIYASNVLGASCARACPVEVLCVGACVHNAAGVAPIQIGKLQRYSAERAVKEDWRFAEAGPDTGKRVALVGAGPASLACAHELRRQGHACTIFEKNAVPGGLNVTGIAPYKLHAPDAMAELEWVLRIGGIEIATGTEVGADVTFEELEQRFDAVFVGMGLGPDRTLPGADRPGVEGAVHWIERMKLGTVDVSGVTHAIVLGGGNTAIDAVRELLALGVPSVQMAYRGGPERMSGYAHEWDQAKKSGAQPVWNAVPTDFLGDDRVTGVRFRGADGHAFDLPAQLVLLAIGQSRLGERLSALAGVEVDPTGRLLVHEDGRLGRPGWFAGGDCANGGKEVVNAVAEGKRAAAAIHAYLNGGARA